LYPDLSNPPFIACNYGEAEALTLPIDLEDEFLTWAGADQTGEIVVLVHGLIVNGEDPIPLLEARSGCR
jgi:hypothetical protein